MEELARVLAGECRALELLLFKLKEAQHLLTEGDDRFYALASAELDRVVTLVREAELKRAMIVRDDPLVEIAATAPAPYGTILDDHRAALRDLLNEIEQVRDTSCQLARTAVDGSQALTANTCDLSFASLRDFLA
jgi:hypothetical protein